MKFRRVYFIAHPLGVYRRGTGGSGSMMRDYYVRYTSLSRNIFEKN